MTVAEPGPDEKAPNIRILKFVVIALGILIVLLGAGVGYGVIRNMGRMAQPQPPAAIAAQPPAAAPAAGASQGEEPLTGFGSQTLVLPMGARVLDAQAAEGRLVVRVLRPDGNEMIVLYALTGGAKLGELNVVHRQ